MTRSGSCQSYSLSWNTDTQAEIRDDHPGCLPGTQMPRAAILVKMTNPILGLMAGNRKISPTSSRLAAAIPKSRNRVSFETLCIEMSTGQAKGLSKPGPRIRRPLLAGSECERCVGWVVGMRIPGCPRASPRSSSLGERSEPLVTAAAIKVLTALCALCCALVITRPTHT